MNYLTEWDEIRNIDISRMVKLMAAPVIFDGRNCFSLKDIEKFAVEYYSVGRPAIVNV